MLKTKSKYNYLLNALINKYGEKNKALLGLHFNTLLNQASKALSTSKRKLLKSKNQTNHILNTIDSLIIGIIDINFYPYGNKELIKNETSKNLLKYLLHETNFDLNLLSIKFLKSFFIKENIDLIKTINDEFKYIFTQIYISLKKDLISNLAAEILIGHLLSMYSLSKPEMCSQITIPQYINNRWEEITYEIKPLFSIKKKFIYAYNLLTTNPKANNILIFKSTPQPTDKAYLFLMLSNFTPGFSIGKPLYIINKKTLKSLIQKQYKDTNKKIKIYGQSLGGNLAYYLGLDNPKETLIHAYSSAGIFINKKKNKKINGTIFSKKNDLINLVNKLPENLSHIKILGTKNNILSSHFKIFGCEKALLIKINNNKENKRCSRKILSIAHQLISIPLFILKSFSLSILLLLKKV